MTPPGTASRPLPEPGENSATGQVPGSVQDYLSSLLDALGDKIAAEGESLDSTLERIAIAAQSFTGASGAAIALRQNGDVVCRARSGESAPPLGTQLDANSGISGECLRTGQPILVEDTEADPRVDAEVCRSLDLRSMALVAISHDGVTDGVLEVFSTQPETFAAHHVAALQQLARLVLKATALAAAPVAAVPPSPVPSQEPQAASAAPVSRAPVGQTAPVSRPPILQPPGAPAPMQKAASTAATSPRLPEKRVLAPVAPAAPQKPAAPEKSAPAKPPLDQQAPLPETETVTAVSAVAAAPAAKPAASAHDLPAPEFKAAQMQSGGSPLFSALKAAWLRPVPLTVLLILAILGVVYYVFYRG